MKLLLFDKDGKEINYRIGIWDSMKINFLGGLGWTVLYILFLLVLGMLGLFTA